MILITEVNAVNISSNDHIKEGNVQTIQELINQAKEGSIIYIKEGIYNEIHPSPAVDSLSDPISTRYFHLFHQMWRKKTQNR